MFLPLKVANLSQLVVGRKTDWRASYLATETVLFVAVSESKACEGILTKGHAMMN